MSRMAGPNNQPRQDQNQKQDQKQDTTLTDQNMQGNREEARQQITRRINMDQKGGQLLQSGELSNRPNDFGRDAIFDPIRQNSVRTEQAALQMLLPLCQRNEKGQIVLAPIPEAKGLIDAFKNPAIARSYVINPQETAAELSKTFPQFAQVLSDNAPFFVDRAKGTITVNPKSSLYYLVAKEVEAGTKASDSPLRKDLDKLLSSALGASLRGSSGLETKAYELIRADVERAKLASELDKPHKPKEITKIQNKLQDSLEQQKRLELRTAKLLDSPQAREDFKEVQGIHIVATRNAAAAQPSVANTPPAPQPTQRVVADPSQFLKGAETPQMKIPPATPASTGVASAGTAPEVKLVADPGAFIKEGAAPASPAPPATPAPQTTQRVIQDPSQFIKSDAAAPQMKPSATAAAATPAQAPETRVETPQQTRRMDLDQKGAPLLQSGQLSNRPNDFGRDAIFDPARQGSLRTEHVALQMLLPLCQRNEKGEILLAPIPEAQGLFNEFKNPANVRSYLIKPQETAAELARTYPQFAQVLNDNVPFFVDKAKGSVTVNPKSSVYYLVAKEVESGTKASDSRLRKDMDKLLTSPLVASLGGSAGMETKAYELVRADVERAKLASELEKPHTPKEISKINNRLQDALERQKRAELRIVKLTDSPQANQDFKEVQGIRIMAERRAAAAGQTSQGAAPQATQAAQAVQPVQPVQPAQRVVEDPSRFLKGAPAEEVKPAPSSPPSPPTQATANTAAGALSASEFKLEAPSVRDPAPRPESFNVSYNGEPLQFVSTQAPASAAPQATPAAPAQPTAAPNEPAKPAEPKPAPAQDKNVVTLTQAVVTSVYDARANNLTLERSAVPNVKDTVTGPPSNGEALRMIAGAVQELKARNGGTIKPGQPVTVTIDGKNFPIDIYRVPAPQRIDPSFLTNATRDVGLREAIIELTKNTKITVERTSRGEATITYPKGISVTLGDLAKPAPAPNAGPQPANEPAKQAAPQAQPAPANPPQPAANPEVNTDLQAMKARLDALEKQNEELRTELKKYTSGTPATEPKPAQPAPQPSTPAASPAPTPSSPPDLKAIAAQVQNGIGTFADNEEAMRAPLIKLSAEDLVQLGNQVVRQERNRGGTVIREVSLKEEVLKNLNGEQRKEFEARFDGNHLLADAYVVSYELSRVNVGNIARKDLHEALLRVKSSLGENATGEGALGYIKDYTDLGQNFNSGNIQANIRNMDSDFLKELRSNNPTTKVDKPRSIVVPTTATTSPAVDDEVTTKVKNKFLEVEQFAKMDATAYNSLMDDLITSARERLKSTSSPITGDNLIEAVKKEMTDRQKALFDFKIEE